MKYFLAILFYVSFAAASVAAQSPRTITMRDGSQIQGRIISLQNGHYIIESSSLGKIDLKESDVVSIESQDSTKHPLTNSDGGDPSALIQDTTNKILNDPELMADIQELASDPQFASVIMDPAFLSAVETQNVQAIKNNPQTAKLLSNPKMQALLRKLMAAQKSK